VSMDTRRHNQNFPRRAPRPVRTRVLGWTLSMAGIVSALVWFLFVSGYWRVRTFDIQGLQEQNRGEVSTSVFYILDHGPWKPWDRRNIFWLNRKAVEEALKEKLFAEEVVVDKKYPDILRLKIKERQQSVTLVSKNQFLSVDTNGLVTGEAQGQALNLAHDRLAGKILSAVSQTPLIVVDLTELAAPGYQVVEAQVVRRWIETYRKLVNLGVQFRYLGFDQAASPTLKIVSAKGYAILMNTHASLEPQVEAYKKFIQAQPKKLSIKEYVDVRVPGKIFVK